MDYQVIYADPPWQYRRQTIKDYETMSNEELAVLPVPSIAARNSVLCMWATFPKLQAALATMQAWGFRYTTQLITWIKTDASGRPKLGLGHYTRGNAEVVLLGVRGKGMKRCRRNISSVLLSRARQHSRKPDEVRDLLVDLFGHEARRVELFARTRYAGWDAHGNQAQKFSGETRTATHAVQTRITKFATRKE
jgi:N6-adenosine-specific RNA methylase IME4